MVINNCKGITLPEPFKILNPENNFRVRKLDELTLLFSNDTLEEFNLFITETENLLKYNTKELRLIIDIINDIYYSRITTPATQKCYYHVHQFITTYRWFSESITKKLKSKGIRAINGEACWCISFILNLEILLFNLDTKNAYSRTTFLCLERMFFMINYYYQYPLEKKAGVQITIQKDPQSEKREKKRQESVTKFRKDKLKVIKLHKLGYSNIDIIEKIQTCNDLEISIENLENTVSKWVSSYKKFKKNVGNLKNEYSEEQSLNINQLADNIYSKLHLRAVNKYKFRENLTNEDIYFEILEILNR